MLKLLKYMLILVVVGFGLLTNYTFSNTNQNIAEGTLGDMLDEARKSPEVPDLPEPEPEPEPDETTEEEEKEDERAAEEDALCDDPDANSDICNPNDDDDDDEKDDDNDNDKDDDNDNDKDDDNDNDKDDDSDNDNEPQPIPYQPQPQSQILIPQANIPPTAMNSSVVTTQNRSINISLEIYDKEGDMLDISIPEAPKFGNLAIKDVNTKTLTYTPNSNYIGFDSFIFQGNDRKAPSNNATVSINIANPPPQPIVPSSTSNNSLTFSTKAGSQSNASQPLVTPSTAPTNTQNLNNLNQVQLVDLIASTISNANNIDKNKVTQSLNDFIEPTKAKGGNVIDSLKKIANVILKEPSGSTAIKIVNIAKTK